MKLERQGKHMKKVIDVNKAEELVEKIAELLGGLEENEELYIEIEVRQVESEDAK